MGSIQISQRLLLDTDSLLELLDVLGSPLSKRCLSLAVSLLPLLCGRIDLEPRQYSVTNPAPHTAGPVEIPRDWTGGDRSRRTRKQENVLNVPACGPPSAWAPGPPVWGGPGPARPNLLALRLPLHQGSSLMGTPHCPV